MVESGLVAELIFLYNTIVFCYLHIWTTAPNAPSPWKMRGNHARAMAGFVRIAVRAKKAVGVIARARKISGAHPASDKPRAGERTREKFPYFGIKYEI